MRPLLRRQGSGDLGGSWRDPLRIARLPRTLPFRVATAIGTLLALLAAILAASVLALRAIDISANQRYAGSAVPLQRLVSDLLVQMVNQETGVRGFLITRKVQSLAPYVNGQNAVRRDLEAVQPYLPEHPRTAALLRRAEPQIHRLEVYFSEQVALVTLGHVRLARSRVELGREEFDGFRTTAARMQADTARYVRRLNGDQTHTYHEVLGALLALGGLALAVGVWLFLRAPARLRRLLGELAESEQRRQAVLNEMMRAEQGERERLATELHDDTIQVMTAALLTLDRLERSLDEARGERERAAIARSRKMLESAVERTRRLIFEVRPPLLEAHGLEPALRELADQAAAEAGFAVSVSASVERYHFVVEDMAYRIVREAVANARKHAQASHLEIELAESGGLLRGRVSDDGRGFDLDAALDRSAMRMHVGLDSMIERVRLAGGSMRIETRPGAGATLRFEIPLGVADMPAPVLSGAGRPAAVG